MKSLPGKAYALAFLRSYVRALGLDEKTIVDQFQEESALTREDAQKQIRDPSSKPGPGAPLAGCGSPGADRSGVCRLADAANEEARRRRKWRRAKPSARRRARPRRQASRRLAFWRSRRTSMPGWRPAGRTARYSCRGPCARGMFTGPTPAPVGPCTRATAALSSFTSMAFPQGLLGTAGMPVLGRAIDGIEPLTQAELALALLRQSARSRYATAFDGRRAICTTSALGGALSGGSSRKIRVGAVEVGGDAPITVQSMTNTPTADASADHRANSPIGGGWRRHRAGFLPG